MWGSKSRKASVGLFPGRDVLGPIFIMIACPIMTIIFASVLSGVSKEHSATEIFKNVSRGNLFLGHLFDYPRLILMVLGFIVVNFLCLMYLPPTQLIQGPVTPGGLYPLYVDNGIQSLIANLVLFYLCSDFGPLRLFPIDVWMRSLPELLLLTNACSFVFCFWLYKRNQTRKTLDFSTRGNAITDFYVGNELHPRFLDSIDIKQFTNCRFGMMLWPIMVVSAAGSELKCNGSFSYASSVAYGLQMLYLIKFFIWEKGYFFTLDMCHDRAGFYLCWGCMCWVPCVYALTSTFHGITSHCDDISMYTMLVMAAVGIVSLVLNYHSDLQRKQFREAGDNPYYILGKEASFIVAKYKTEDGKARSNKLLTSGYWGISRHFNYFAELVFSYTIGLTAAFVGQGVFGALIGLFYPVFLTILLVDRCYRDEARCLSKYGSAWKKYCQKVPFRLIPGLF